MKKNMFIGVCGGLVGYLLGRYHYKRNTIDKVTEVERYGDKYFCMFSLVCEWLKCKQEGKALYQYFLKKGFKRIAIYGVGNIGQLLYAELKETIIEVVYAIERRKDVQMDGLKIVSLDEELEEVDAIVVTSVFEYDEICKIIEERMRCQIISLEDIIFFKEI